MDKEITRRNVTVTIFDEQEYDGEWPPTDATECVAWFAKKLSEIPEEHRASARISIDGRSGYDSSVYGHIEIYYTRPETDAELAEREARARQQAAQTEAMERRALAALVAKYGSQQ